MSGYKSQKDLLKDIQSTLDQLENGQLTIEELEQYVENARELYERSIVLRYKAFEEKVGISKPEATVSEEAIEETVEEEVIVESTPTVEENEPIVEEQAAEPTFDFSMFSQPEEAETPAATEEKEEHISISRTSEEKDGVTEETTTIEATVETVTQTEEPITPVSPTTGADFEAKFKAIVTTIDGQIGFNKLDSLIGSFGLNERLQFINELFDGSSESFADAVKALDSQSDLENAKGRLASFADNNQWDLESDTVEEFIQKVCRRYA